MRSTGSIFLLLASVLPWSGACWGQAPSVEYRYPGIPETAERAAALIPIGWTEYERIEFDLNMDGVNDLVLAIQTLDSIAHSRSGKGISRGRPRMLLVALGSNKGIYRTITTNSDFLLREDEGGMTPPELWMEAKGDTLQVGFQLLRGNSTYSFIHKNNDLICVRSDQAGASGSGYMEVMHIDLISNVAERWTGRVDMDQLNREREIVIPPHPPILLSSMKPAMSTELVPGFFF